jgi:hypothetical protein
MATSIAMAKLLAAATGISPQTLLVEVRRLGEANQISRGGRGKNAPEMSPLDTARMLIGLLTSERPEDMPKGVRAFGSLRTTAGVWLHGEPTDDTIKLPPYPHSFEIAIAEIIKRLADLPANVKPPKIRIVAIINDLLCQIYLGGQRYEYAHATLSDIANKLTDDRGPFLLVRRRYADSKISVVRTVEEGVLAEIAASFRKEGEVADVKCA